LISTSIQINKTILGKYISIYFNDVRSRRLESMENEKPVVIIIIIIIIIVFTVINEVRTRARMTGVCKITTLTLMFTYYAHNDNA